MEMSFGARLRQQREERQVALEDISAKTKIKVSFLEGLEADDLSRWPQGIFRRAYIRAYAQAIGLEADVVVQHFLALYPEPEEELPLVAPESPKRPPTRLRFLLSAAFGAASRLTAADNREGTGGRVGHMSHVNHPEPVVPVNQLEPIEVAEAVEAPYLAAEPADLVPPFTRPPLSSVADLCTRIGRVSTLLQLELPLADAVRMLNAVGAVLWTWEIGR